MAEPIQLELERRTFSPGDTVRGTLRFGDLSDAAFMRVRGARVQLVAQLQGHFQDELVTVVNHPVLEAAPTDAECPFEVDLPDDCPVTHTGKTITVRCFVRAQLDAPGELGSWVRREVTIAPRGPSLRRVESSESEPVG